MTHETIPIRTPRGIVQAIACDCCQGRGVGEMPEGVEVECPECGGSGCLPCFDCSDAPAEIDRGQELRCAACDADHLRGLAIEKRSRDAEGPEYDKYAAKGE